MKFAKTLKLVTFSVSLAASVSVIAQQSMYIESSGDVGIGTDDPIAPLNVVRVSSEAPSPADAPAGILVEDYGVLAPRGLMTLVNNGQVFFALVNDSIAEGPDSGRQWNFQNLGGTFRVTTAPGGPNEVEMVLDVDGNMTIEGNYFAASGTQLNVPDYVFAPDYNLAPLSEVAKFIQTHSHLPDVPSAAEIAENGLNMTDMQMRHLKKIEELTLYTLDQETRIAAQETTIGALAAQVASLAAQLENLEK